MPQATVISISFIGILSTSRRTQAHIFERRFGCFCGAGATDGQRLAVNSIGDSANIATGLRNSGKGLDDSDMETYLLSTALMRALVMGQNDPSLHETFVRNHWWA
jgi:hypothetical protein